VPSAVGAFVARVRRDNGATLDQIAHAARSHGASWSASSVSNIERGQASLTLPTLLLLALALGDVLGRPLTLSALLGDAELLTLGGDGQDPVDRPWMDRVLTGAEVARSADERVLPKDDFEDSEELDNEVFRRMRESHGKGLTPGERNDQFAQHLDQFQMPPEPAGRNSTTGDSGSLAEERAAKKLGLSTTQLRKLALDLWAHSLEEESSRRAGSDSTPQARGRVTRVLVDELRVFAGEAR